MILFQMVRPYQMNNLLFKRKGGIDGEVEEGVVAADVYLIEN